MTATILAAEESFLVQNDDAMHGAKTFLNDTGLGKFIKLIAGVVGLLVVLFGVFNVVKAIGAASPAQAFKSAIFALIAAAFLFNLEWALDLIGLMQQLVSSTLEGLGKLVDSAGN